MGKAKTADLVAQTPLFSSCSRRQIAAVAALTLPNRLPAGTVLTRQGAAGGIAFILASGNAEVVRGRRRLAVLGPGDVVGELSLIDGRRRSATVTALTDLEVLEIDGRDLRRLLRKVPMINRKLLTALAGRLRHADGLPTAGL
ncbi:MAG: cyclic nucleotide-binding domain-containing protein [Acidimicrobiales bacterium]